MRVRLLVLFSACVVIGLVIYVRTHDNRVERHGALLETYGNVGIKQNIADTEDDVEDQDDADEDDEEFDEVSKKSTLHRSSLLSQLLDDEELFRNANVSAKTTETDNQVRRYLFRRCFCCFASPPSCRHHVIEVYHPSIVT